MANIASLLINIGVKLDGALVVENKLKNIRKSATEMGRKGKVATTRFGRAFQAMGKQIRKAAARARASIAKLVDRMGGLRGIATAGAVAFAGAAVGIYKLVESQTAALDATNKMSASLGMTVEELQRLRFIAGQSGVATSTLERAMRNVNRNLLDVASGGGKAVRENLAALNLTIKDLDGLSRTQQLGLIGERLKGISNEAERSAISAKLFGEVAGPEMQSLLAEGRDGLERLGASAKNVFSQEDADRASAFQDRMGEVKDQVAALVTGLAIDLLPAVQNVILEFQAWLAENEGLIAQKLPEILDDIAGAAQAVFGAVTSVTSGMQALGVQAGTLEIAMVGLGIVVAAQVHPFLALVAAAFALGDQLARITVLSGRARGGVIHGIAEQVGATARLAEVVPYGVGAGTRVLPRRGVARGRGGGRGAAGARGGKAGWLSGALREGAELTRDALFRMQTGLPRRGGASVDEAIQVLLSGRGAGSPLFENLQRMAARTPSTADIKPTVAMDITINQQFSNKQSIVAPDPQSAADKSAVAIRKVLRQETAKAGQAIAGNVVR